MSQGFIENPNIYFDRHWDTERPHQGICKIAQGIHFQQIMF